MTIDEHEYQLAAFVSENNLMLVLHSDNVLTGVFVPVMHLTHTQHCTHQS